MGLSAVAVNAVDDVVQPVESSGDFYGACDALVGRGVGGGFERDIA